MSKIYIAVPCYSQKIQLECAFSIIKLHETLRCMNVSVQMSGLTGESLLFIARNVLVREFMNSDCTHMLFIDDDIEFDALDIIKMLDANKGVIGGAYSTKNTSDPMLVSSSISHVEQYDQMPIVNHVGTGLLLIQRHVFQHIYKTAKIKEINHNGSQLALFFNHMTSDGTYMSEDYYFCNIWRECGGLVYLAKWTTTRHFGVVGFSTSNVIF
jgi:hypothetical protein